jgi:hypothetical protein
MSRITYLVLALASVMAIGPVRAATTADGFVYEIVAGKVTITGYAGSGGDIVVPAAVAGTSVESIGPFAFFSKANITGIVLPAGLKTVQDRAFENCVNLTRIAFSDTLMAFAGNAIQRCDRLTHIEIPAANSIYKLSADGSAVLSKDGKTLVTHVRGRTTTNYALPSGVVEVGDGAFTNSRLSHITIPEGVTRIGYGSFGNSDLREVHLPGTLSSLVGNAFQACTSLVRITVAADNRFFSSDGTAIYNLSRTTLYYVASSVVGSYAVAPAVREIGWAAFAGAQYISRLWLPEGLAVVNGFAFGSMPRMTEIIFPSSLSRLDGDAFAFSNLLTTIYFRGNRPSSNGNPLNSSVVNTIVYPKGNLSWPEGSFFGATTVAASAPQITIQPKTQALKYGDALGLTIDFTGTPALIQWYLNGVEIPHATGKTYTVPKIASQHAGTYSAVVYNNIGEVASSAANITLAPLIVSQPSSQAVTLGSPMELSVVATAVPAPSYQWTRAGIPLVGATSSSLKLTSITAGDAGSYAVLVTNSAGATRSSSASVEIIPSNSLANVSVRTSLATGQALIVGAVISGGIKPILARAGGPALNQFGLQGMADPRIDLFTTSATPIAINNDWASPLAATFTEVGAFAYQPGSKDAALRQVIGGSFTVQTTGTGPGAVLVELYDINGGTAARMINVSTRNYVGTGADVLIAGFAINGRGTKNLIVRGIGPGLRQFGLSGVLEDPKIQVYDGNSSLVSSNDNWASALGVAFNSVGAFGLPANSKDAALLVTLGAGSSYTVVLSGADGGTGEALLEVYELP